jgi:hypothetical protein
LRLIESEAMGAEFAIFSLNRGERFPRSSIRFNGATGGKAEFFYEFRAKFV